MRYGEITCECGQVFYFETKREEISCIQCHKKYDVKVFAEMKEVEETDDE